MMILRRKKRKEKKAKKLQEAQQQAYLAALQMQGGNTGGSPYISNSRRPPSAMSVPVMAYNTEKSEEEDEDEISTGSELNLEGDAFDLQQSHTTSMAAVITTAGAVGPELSVTKTVLADGNQSHTLQHQKTAAPTGTTYPSLAASLSMQNLTSSHAAAKDYSKKTALQQPATSGFPMQPSVPVTPAAATEIPFLHSQSLIQHPGQQQGTVAPPAQVMNQQQQLLQLQAAQLQQQFQNASIPAPSVTPLPTHYQQVPYVHQQLLMPPVSRSNGGSGTLKRLKEQHKKMAAQLSPEKAELVSTAISLGLGRGIDATDKMPWLNKTAFQVRRIHGSIVETNEGGILMNYNHAVQSIAEVEEQFLGSFNPPESTVTIHVEDELDRNVSSTRRIVGQRVINRSIGFQADFEERYKDGEVIKITKDLFLIPKDPAEVVHNTQESAHTFEDRVCSWILHRLIRKCSVSVHKNADENPTEQLAKVLRSKPAANIEAEINIGCQELIKTLKITHYVTGMQLGAAEYHVMSDGQYHKKMASKGAFGVDTLASNVWEKGSSKKQKKEAMKCSQLRKLGKIEDSRVAKGTQDEVVLQVQVQPITRLIKLPDVKLALKNALEKYMEGTPSTEGGPFVIKCTGRDLYLTVNKFNNYEVEATDLPTEASLFYFQTTDEGGNPFEFHVAYYGEDADPNDKTSDEDSAICRYLEAPLNSQGRCPGPLLMKHSVKIKNTRFTLRSRLSKKNNRSHLAEWMAGEDAFYIACATKKYQHGSYLAVKNIKNTGDLIGKHFYMTYCDSTIHNHNGENVMMLFQLYTKEAVLTKGTGRETPGKLPVIQPATEVETRKKQPDVNNSRTPLLKA